MKLRAHLLVNEASGTGQDTEIVARIRRALENSLDLIGTTVVKDHASAAAQARLIATETREPLALFVGGGGGTLRGVIEGIAAASDGSALPGPERLRLAPLRLGSGNLLAKTLGVPKDPLQACERFLTGLDRGRFRHCVVGRYDFEREDGATETRYAATLAGFGQLGRVPGDLERWHARSPWLRRALVRVIGLERSTDVEYGAVMILRGLRAALVPRSLEEVRIECDGREERMRLLAGVVLSFRVPSLPFVDGPGPGESRLSAFFVPYRSRIQALTLVFAARRHARAATRCDVEPGRPLVVTLTDRKGVEMFLDEDPIRIDRKVTVRIAGTLAFVSEA